MPPLSKLLSQLDSQSRKIADKVIDLIFKGQTKDLDIKKLKGANNLYRIRKGKLRIIYKRGANIPEIIAIQKRSDNTYGKLKS